MTFKFQSNLQRFLEYQDEKIMLTYGSQNVPQDKGQKLIGQFPFQEIKQRSFSPTFNFCKGFRFYHFLWDFAPTRYCLLYQQLVLSLGLHSSKDIEKYKPENWHLHPNFSLPTLLVLALVQSLTFILYSNSKFFISIQYIGIPHHFRLSILFSVYTVLLLNFCLVLIIVLVGLASGHL